MGLQWTGKLGKIFLVIINVVFLLFGLGILIAGILFKTSASIVTDGLKPVLNNVTFGDFTLYSLANSASIVMICAGVFVFILAALGCVGACCQLRPLLVVYAITVSIIVIIELAGVILWFKMNSWLTDHVKTEMKTLLDHEYKGNVNVGTNNAVSVSYNLLFKTMKCCGVNAVKPPATTAVTNDFVSTTWWASAGRGSDKIPQWCCEASTASKINAGTFTDADCTVNLKKYYTEGCFDAVVNTVKKYSSVFIGVGITVIVVEILAIVFAFCMCRQIGKDK